ncbi:MAG TPA: hypothetical protein VID76_00885 [Solirubrobacterales bacterium]
MRRNRGADTAVAEPDSDALFAEIDSLAAANRERRDPDLERRILQLRHEAGALLAGADDSAARFPEPASEQLREGVDGQLPEYAAAELTPELLRAGLLRDGSVLVRGLLDRDEAIAFAAEIERAVRSREAFEAGDEPEPGYYEEFGDGLGYERAWVGVGGLWAADSPKLMFDMLDAFERSGLRRVIHGYLGEVPALSVQKCTMRKVDPDSGSGWHQDGAFLGQVRALNVWLSLSRCGDLAPGLDVIPRRLDEIVATGTEGAAFDWSVAPDVVERVAAEAGVRPVRPIFEPGDVLLFDEMNLHATAADPSMPNPRYAIESWFFGLSGFPAEYVPLAY